MSPPSTRDRWAVAAMIAACMLAFVPASVAQRNQGPSRGGGAQVQVRVFLENNQSAGPALQVQLMTGLGMLLSQGFTDSSGMVRFNSVAPGSYRLHVSGVGFNDAETDSFQVLDLDVMSFQMVRITRNKQAALDAGGPPVSAFALNVPQKARDQFLKGMQLLQKGHREEGMKCLKKATEIYPHYAEAFDWMGVASLPGDPGYAKQAFGGAIQADDKYVPAYVHLSRILIDEKDYAQSQQYLAKSLAIDPRSVESLFLLSYVNLLQDRVDEAIESGVRADRVPHQKFPILHMVLGEAYARKGSTELAKQQFLAYLKEAPKGDQAEQARKGIEALSAAPQP